ncbi:hypothetical protein [Hazenella coriacea]|uniref:hypothetical protein n=1 Tax=Hazenella coriacea TaxID=1179467 RepID=UPI0014046A91|nr:hypothetical protein [Hazenella coriacea]
MTRSYMDGSVWNAKVVVASANPLVTLAPNIDYSHYSRVSPDGSGYHEVLHDRAPSHEMYIYNYPGDDYMILMRDKHQGFHYLLPGYQKARVITNDPFF